MDKFHVIAAVVFLAIGIWIGARYSVPYIGKSSS